MSQTNILMAPPNFDGKCFVHTIQLIFISTILGWISLQVSIDFQYYQRLLQSLNIAVPETVIYSDQVDIVFTHLKTFLYISHSTYYLKQYLRPKPPWFDISNIFKDCSKSECMKTL